jgi:4-amino-4-deoxy-L-arabinose transferase-like glycosyltransferase
LGAWLRRKADPALGFLLGWAVGPLILLECVQTKLVHYYLPAAPAVVMLAAWLVYKVSEAEVNLRRWRLGRVSLGLLTGIGIGVTVALLACVMVLPWTLRWPSLMMAATIAAGTLLAMERFHSGRTIRAAYCLVGTWAAVLLLGGAWLLPSAERYRISRLVGERLGALAAREGALPMLATFRQPSVVYTMRRHAPFIYDRAGFFERVRREGAVVTALMAHELASLSLDTRGTIEIREVVEGFNIDKGRQEKLHLVVVRPPGGSGALTRAGQQTRVE